MIPARPSALLLRYFDGYVPRLLKRRFHRVWLWGPPGAVPAPAGRPVIYAMTHASWWDVLVGYQLARHVVRLPSYAPMDEAQLRRYRVLARLGLYSVDRGSRAGTSAFLAYTEARLREPAAVWLTPQGAIVPARRRPVCLERGIGHLLRRVPSAAVVPVAVVYEFLEEPRPEIFVKFGPAGGLDRAGETAAAIAARIGRDMERELDALDAALLARDLGPFTLLLEGATSTNRVYDLVRRGRALVTGRPDPARHGDVVSDPRRRPSR